ncbi:MAG: hypothetical protein PVI43_00785 [Candidatus Bathyarchaeota archaeon]|jgi:hypothetical protein
MKARKGLMVNVKSGGWGRVLEGCGSTHKPVHLEVGNTEYRVLATKCALPLDNHNFANTLIQNIETKICIAINEDDLIPAISEITLDFHVNGIRITDDLSIESKKAILHKMLDTLGA